MQLAAGAVHHYIDAMVVLRALSFKFKFRHLNMTFTSNSISKTLFMLWLPFTWMRLLILALLRSPMVYLSIFDGLQHFPNYGFWGKHGKRIETAYSQSQPGGTSHIVCYYKSLKGAQVHKIQTYSSIQKQVVPCCLAVR